MKRVRLAVVLLAVAGLVDSAYLTWLKIVLMQQGQSCGFGGCDVVNASSYSMLFGVPVALWGAITYAVIIGLSLFWIDASAAPARRLGLAIAALSGWGFLFSAYLTWVEIEILHAICPFCVVSAVIITLILVLSLIELWRLRREE